MKTVYATALLSIGLLFWLLLQPENPPASTTSRVLIGVGTLFLFCYGVMVHHKSKIIILLLSILGVITIGLIFEYLLIYSIDVHATVSIITTISVVVFIISYAFNMIVRHVLN